MENKEIRIDPPSILDKGDSLAQQKTTHWLLMPPQSDQLNELFTALAKAQGEFDTARNRSENPFFKSRYADFNEIVNASRTALCKYGLCVIQRIFVHADGSNHLYTMLCHASGQYIMSQMRLLPVKNDIQSFGSVVSYSKRYGYSALVGVVTADEDDDGERAMVEARETVVKGTALNTKYDPREQSRETISSAQLDELEYELAEYTDLAKEVKEALMINSLADMPRSKFRAAIERIRSIKASRNNVKK